MAITIKREEGSLREELSGQYARLNEAWLRAEIRAKNLLVPVSVAVEFDRVDLQDGRQLFSYLGFLKHRGEWKICHGVENLDEDGEEFTTWKPISDCAFDIRVNCVKHFPLLMKRIVAEARNTIPRIDSAIEQLDADIE